MNKLALLEESAVVLPERQTMHSGISFTSININSANVFAANNPVAVGGSSGLLNLGDGAEAVGIQKVTIVQL